MQSPPFFGKKDHPRAIDEQGHIEGSEDIRGRYSWSGHPWSEAQGALRNGGILSNALRAIAVGLIARSEDMFGPIWFGLRGHIEGSEDMLLRCRADLSCGARTEKAKVSWGKN